MQEKNIPMINLSLKSGLNQGKGMDKAIIKDFILLDGMLFKAFKKEVSLWV